MFIFPKKVINCMHAIWKWFLWFRINNSHKSGVVRWKQVCKSKKFRNLGMRDISVWNQVVVRKIAWHIYMMKDSLWVRWVHDVYTKGGNWALFNAPSTTSLIIKKLCFIKFVTFLYKKKKTPCLILLNFNLLD